MSIGIKLRTLLTTDVAVDALLGDATAPGAVQQNKIDENGPATRIYFVRTGAAVDRFLSSAPGITETAFDVECHSPDIDTALDLAAAVKTALDGLWQDSTLDAQAVFVDDHDDSYLPKGDYQDAGTHVAALQVTIFHN